MQNVYFCLFNKRQLGGSKIMAFLENKIEDETTFNINNLRNCWRKKKQGCLHLEVDHSLGQACE